MFKQLNRPLVYIRVSSKEQEGNTSIESQTSRIDEFASVHQLQIEPDDRYIEIASGIRQNQLTRVGELRQVVKRAIEEKRPIIVTHIDRLTRSIDVVNEIFDAGITIIEAKCNDTINRERAISYLNGTVIEREKKTENQQIAYDRKRAAGEPMGNPDIDSVQKLGAASVRSKADLFMQEMIPLIQPLLDQGMNPNRIAAELNNQDVPTLRGAPWSRNAVVNIIKRHEKALQDSQPDKYTHDLDSADYADHPEYGLFS
ncbi:recombinase family protein [Neptuniibacter pectenicola]|uniref:recombinase family protein n=1 Tax=Neptuniibacter pectenicola TaxID=1806669 RepID=UPI000832374F|nr:recombinase family protein [Neptuniibacter pectenicola]